MLNFKSSLKSGLTAVMIGITTFGAIAPAMAQDRGRHERNDRGNNDRNDNRRDNDRNDNRRSAQNDNRRWDRNDRHDNRRDNDRRPSWRGDRHWDGPPRYVAARPRPPSYYRYYATPRTRYYNNVRIYRPYGHPYAGFGFYYRDNDAARFLGLTALSFIALNALNERQQRAHEEAMIQATSAPIGEPIIWDEGGRQGRVVAVRDGYTEDGRQCREFQQEVIIDGRREQAYGTACLQPDGSWETVNDPS